MNKKLLKIALYSALAVVSTGFVYSCSDYDDDINDLQSQINDLKTKVDAIQTSIDNGAILTSVASTSNGITVSLSNGKSYNITNGADGKDGANGKDGINGTNGKDGVDGTNGKDGSVCTIDATTGNWLIDGKDTGIKAEATELTVDSEGYVCIDGKRTAYKLPKDIVVAVLDDSKLTITGASEEPIVIYLSAVISEISFVSEDTPVNECFYSEYAYSEVKDINGDGKAYTFGPNDDVTFVPGTQYVYKDSILIRVSPANAKVDAENLKIVTTAGESKYFEVKSVEPYTETLTYTLKSAASNGLYYVVYGLKEGAKAYDAKSAASFYGESQPSENEYTAYAISSTDENGYEAISGYKLFFNIESTTPKKASHDANFSVNGEKITGNDWSTRCSLNEDIVVSVKQVRDTDVPIKGLYVTLNDDNMTSYRDWKTNEYTNLDTYVEGEKLNLQINDAELGERIKFDVYAVAEDGTQYNDSFVVIVANEVADVTLPTATILANKPAVESDAIDATAYFAYSELKDEYKIHDWTLVSEDETKSYAPYKVTEDATAKTLKFSTDDISQYPDGETLYMKAEVWTKKTKEDASDVYYTTVVVPVSKVMPTADNIETIDNCANVSGNVITALAKDGDAEGAVYRLDNYFKANQGFNGFYMALSDDAKVVYHQDVTPISEDDLCLVDVDFMDNATEHQLYVYYDGISSESDDACYHVATAYTVKLASWIHYETLAWGKSAEGVSYEPELSWKTDGQKYYDHQIEGTNSLDAEYTKTFMYLHMYVGPTSVKLVDAKNNASVYYSININSEDEREFVRNEEQTVAPTEHTETIVLTYEDQWGISSTASLDVKIVNE